MRDNDWLELQKEFREKFSPERLICLSPEAFLSVLFDIGETENIERWMKLHETENSRLETDWKVMFYSRKKRFIEKTYLKAADSKEIDSIQEEISSCLKKGFAIIAERKPLETVKDYEALDRCLFKEIGVNAYFEWLHQYFYWIAPEQFSVWHSGEWQKHILFAYGVRPSPFFYGRSGQIALLARSKKLTMEEFASIANQRFGEPRRFFRIGTSNKSEDYFNEWQKNNVAAIGWSDLGPLEHYVQGEQINQKELRQKLQELYYPGAKQLASRKAKELANFYQASYSNIFVAMRGEQLLAMGDSVGSYYYNESVKFSHRKPIHWHCCFADGEKLPVKAEGICTSFCELTNEENLLYLYKKYYKEKLDLSLNSKQNIEKITSVPNLKKRQARSNPIHPLNQILYGAPGTGKTYATVAYALAIIENRAVADEKQTLEQRKKSMERYEQFVKNGQIVFTTFHQSYGYEEFVQGIRPDIQSQAIQFKKVDGVFKQICERAMVHFEQNYVLIIDEINRGNISKIFGELITLLEEDKRIGECNQLTVTLSLGEEFAVPNNLYIIGTMNSADQSISIIDTALRRRFQFVEMPPRAEMIENAVLRDVFQKLNRYLKRELKNTDLLIGHSFFMNRTEEDCEMIFNQSIIPLLYESFYGEEEKIKEALNCLEGTCFCIDFEYGGRIRIKKSENKKSISENESDECF